LPLRSLVSPHITTEALACSSHRDFFVHLLIFDIFGAGPILLSQHYQTLHGRPTKENYVHAEKLPIHELLFLKEQLQPGIQQPC